MRSEKRKDNDMQIDIMQEQKDKKHMSLCKAPQRRILSDGL